MSEKKVHKKHYKCKQCIHYPLHLKSYYCVHVLHDVYPGKTACLYGRIRKAEA